MDRPYAFARAALISQGVIPIRRKHPRDDWDCEVSRLCGRYPELISCAGDADLCAFLFRRKSDGQFFRLIVRGYPGCLTVDTIFKTTAADYRSDWTPQDDVPQPPPAPPDDWASRPETPAAVSLDRPMAVSCVQAPSAPRQRIRSGGPRNFYGRPARVTTGQVRAAIAGLRPFPAPPDRAN